MHPYRRTAALAALLFALFAVAPAPALAVEQQPRQEQPEGQPEPERTPVIRQAPQQPPGLCAPWHRCMAAGMGALLVLTVLFFGAMYGYQRRGFDTIEHRQGNPDGVPVKRE